MSAITPNLSSAAHRRTRRPPPPPPPTEQGPGARFLTRIGLGGVAPIELGAHAAFCLTCYVYMPALQKLSYAGAGNVRTGFFPLVQYLGMSTAAFLPGARQGLRNLRTEQLRLLSGIAILDLCGTCSLYAGLGLAGSALYVLIFSSSVLWTALMRRAWLGKSLTCGQYFALLLIVAGLSATAVDANSTGSETMFGGALVFVGAVFYGTIYVLSELVLSGSGPPPPETVAAFSGLVNSSIMGVYFLVMVLPFLNTLFLGPIEENGVSYAEVALLYFLVFASMGLHYTSLYFLCRTSSVSAGVNRGAQSIGTFAISSLLFCDVQASQCFTAMKGVSTVSVFTGIMVYSFTGAPPNLQECSARGVSFLSQISEHSEHESERANSQSTL